MKCPLLLIGAPLARVKREPDPVSCLKEDCAWWHEGLEACSIYLIQEQLALVFGFLQKIEEKMPSPEFFKK